MTVDFGGFLGGKFGPVAFCECLNGVAPLLDHGGERSAAPRRE